MFFTKNLFAGFIALLIIIQFVYMVRGFRRQQPIANKMAAILLSVILLESSYLISIYTLYYNLALLFTGLYYSFYTISVYVIFNFVIFLGQKNEDDIFIKTVSRCFEAAVAIDCVVLLTNVLTGIYFDIVPLTENGLLFSWYVRSGKYFVYHFLICYLIIFTFLVYTFFNISRNSRLYNRKFFIVLFLYLIVVVANTLYLINAKNWRLDFSLIASSVLVLIIDYYYIVLDPNLEKNSVLTAVTDQISDAVICLDNENHLIYSNNKAKVLTIKNTAEWTYKYRNLKEDVHNDTEVLEMDDGSHVFDVEFRRIRDRFGKISGSYIKLNDRTDTVMNSKMEEFRATHDELTGLYNRNYFFHKAEKILKENPEIPRYLVVTNIKNFKLVNDLFGTKFGDQILKVQAEMLKLADGDNVVLGRISGDKFAMLMPKDRFNSEKAIENTERVKNLASELNYTLHFNIGVYEIANPFENVHTMYDKANLAIKGIKNNYNQVLAMYDTSLTKQIREEKAVINEFRYAIENNQFKMFLQPQIDSRSNKCIGAESLVRWYDLDSGVRYPGQFIGILEKGGLIYELDYFIWKKAVEKLSEWKRNGFGNYYISVNISPNDFYYTDIYADLTGLVEQFGVNPKRLNLEITETMVLDDRKTHLDVIKRLQDYGFNIEMDDFGSGYSSLNTLKDIPMNVLKIDMEFLNAKGNPERGKKIISNIVVMAKALGMQVITEGVENKEQCDFLREAGCDIYQGYYFSRPISVEDFEDKFMEKI